MTPVYLLLIFSLSGNGLSQINVPEVSHIYHNQSACEHEGHIFEQIEDVKSVCLSMNEQDIKSEYHIKRSFFSKWLK